MRIFILSTIIFILSIKISYSQSTIRNDALNIMTNLPQFVSYLPDYVRNRNDTLVIKESYLVDSLSEVNSKLIYVKILNEIEIKKKDVKYFIDFYEYKQSNNRFKIYFTSNDNRVNGFFEFAIDKNGLVLKNFNAYNVED